MRKWMRKLGTVGLALSVALGAASQARAEPAGSKLAGRKPARERRIDLAICLDTSGSMSGLIDSARGKLWQIVSELAMAKPSPHLRVALLTYGTPAYGRGSGWVRVNLDLTDDLDRVYQELFALRTNGGTEYVARVTRRAVDSLSWDRATDTYRVIFVAGNESADQDPELRNEDVCKSAVTRDVVVNAIYCGGAGSSDAEGYRRVARLAEGRYASIDQNGGTVTIRTPFDDDLARLGAELNTTYVAYGRRAREAADNQVRQDENAAKMGPSVAAQRAAAKASSVYRNDGWDLVDAMKKKDFKLEKVAGEALPDEMQKMDLEERKAHIEKMTERRKKLQEKIAELSGKRRAHVEAEMKRQSLSEDKSFDLAVRAAVREQAEAKGFAF